MFTRVLTGSFALPLALAVSLFAGACATSSAPPAAPAAAPPQAAAPAQPAAPAGQTERGPAPAGSSAAPADAPTAASELRFVFTPGTSEARYRAREQFANAQLPNDAIGATKAVSGQVVVDGARNVVRDASKITVDLRGLESDQRQRDQYIQQNTLQTSQFPTAEFVPTEVRGLAATLPASGPLTFQMAGDLTVHGVTRPVVWDVQAQMAGAEATGTARTPVTLADFGMAKPSVARIISIDDTIVLEIDFQASSATSPEMTQADSPRGT